MPSLWLGRGSRARVGFGAVVGAEGPDEGEEAAFRPSRASRLGGIGVGRGPPPERGEEGRALLWTPPGRAGGARRRPAPAPGEGRVGPAALVDAAGGDDEAAPRLDVGLDEGAHPSR